MNDIDRVAGRSWAVLILSLKMAYILMFIIAGVVYVIRSQDGGFVRQEIAILQFFVLAFPSSLYVYFWVIIPLIFVNYLVLDISHFVVAGSMSADVYILILGILNLAAGYHQWFVVLPRFVSAIKHRFQVKGRSRGAE